MRRFVLVAVLAGLMALGAAGPTVAVPVVNMLPNGKPFPAAQPFTTPGGDALTAALANAASHAGG